jgi:D-alanine transaminase/branched-chain amino acid aminotransferase
MHLDPGYSPAELMAIVMQLTEKNNLPDSGIRLTLTGGISPDGMSIGSPCLIVSQHSFTSPGREQLERGVKLITYAHHRQLPHVKTIDYLMPIWLQPFIKEQGADDVLYMHNGCLTECPRANFFLVTQDDTIVTAAEDVLHGITRKKILELARKEFKVEERVVTLLDLESAKEAFITSTTKCVIPVRQIDGRSFTGPYAISGYLLHTFSTTY